jgi:hypothetical protein
MLTLSPEFHRANKADPCSGNLNDARYASNIFAGSSLTVPYSWFLGRTTRSSSRPEVRHVDERARNQVLMRCVHVLTLQLLCQTEVVCTALREHEQLNLWLSATSRCYHLTQLSSYQENLALTDEKFTGVQAFFVNLSRTGSVFAQWLRIYQLTTVV